MSIQRLPGDAAAQIKASASIASLNDAVLGLLRNALDAGAARVAISVDYSRGGCVVEDDGVGIPPAEFLPEGGLAKRYHTSKCAHTAHPSGLHGRSGTFLASVAALSLLTIVSRCQGLDAPSALTIYNSDVLQRRTPAPPDHGLAAACAGTRVTVSDLFGCMPVRARLRPLADSVAWVREWDRLVWAATALLLAWPAGLVVSIQDASGTAKKTLRSDRSGSSRDDVARTSRLLTQADVCEPADPGSWVAVGAAMSGISISGCVCLVPAASKKAQFIRLGVEPLSDKLHAGALYDEINAIFAESSFGSWPDGGRRHTRATRGPLDKFLREQKPRKTVDRWPVFSIGIDSDAALDVDAVLDGQHQHLAVIKGLLRAISVEFLTEHGFYDEPTTLYGAQNGARERESWAEPDSASSEPLASAKKRQKTDGSRLLPSRGKPMHASNDPFSSWPRTKHEQPRKTDAERAGTGPDVTARQPGRPGVEEKSRFFVGPDVPADGNGERKDDPPCGLERDWGECDHNALTSGGMKISRAGLEAAKVMGQVDRKFILVRTAAGGDSETDGGPDPAAEDLLVLVDQHAADERCRVEAMLRNYFVSLPATSAVGDAFGDADTTLLEKPLQFELAPHEHPLMERSKAYFRRWGVCYASTATSGAALLRVYRLPTCIADRCRQEPRLVVDLIRREIWECGAPGGASKAPTADRASAEPSWVSRLYGCPRGILELVNSKACRSAIKFNDPMTHAECVDLVARLLRCSFPFQCAHGRPSMVPVLNLGPSER